MTWEPVPNTKYDFEEFERVTCMHSVNLKSEGTVSGLKPYVAIGTNYAHSEDVTCRGRVSFFLPYLIQILSSAFLKCHQHK